MTVILLIYFQIDFHTYNKMLIWDDAFTVPFTEIGPTEVQQHMHREWIMFHLEQFKRLSTTISNNYYYNVTEKAFLFCFDSKKYANKKII